MTRYQGDCACGRGWFTVDGQLVAAMDINFGRHRALYDAPYHPACGEHDSVTHAAVAIEDRSAGQLVEPEEFSKLDLTHACWQFIHQSIDASLASEHPLVQSLAILDRRVGRGRFERFVSMERDPLPAHFAEIRRLAEGWPAPVRAS